MWLGQECIIEYSTCLLSKNITQQVRQRIVIWAELGQFQEEGKQKGKLQNYPSFLKLLQSPRCAQYGSFNWTTGSSGLTKGRTDKQKDLLYQPGGHMVTLEKTFQDSWQDLHLVWASLRSRDTAYSMLCNWASSSAILPSYSSRIRLLKLPSNSCFSCSNSPSLPLILPCPPMKACFQE